MIRAFLCAPTLAALILAAPSVFASSSSHLLGTWDLVHQSCVASPMELSTDFDETARPVTYADSTVALSSSNFGQQQQLPLPDSVWARFERETFVIDAKYFGCDYQLVSPYKVNNSLIQYTSGKIASQCDSSTLELTPQPFHFQLKKNHLIASGLLDTVFCPKGKTSIFNLVRRKSQK